MRGSADTVFTKIFVAGLDRGYGPERRGRGRYRGDWRVDWGV